MHDPDDAGFENESFDPDDVLWVRGVDYLAGSCGRGRETARGAAGGCGS
jgi:hypothetical protein